MSGKTIAVMLLFFLLFSSLIVVALMIYFNKIPNPFSSKEEQLENVTYSSLTLRAQDVNGEPINVKYVLKEQNTLVVSGDLVKDKLETYNHIIENITYYLYTFDYDDIQPNYYLADVTCDYTSKKCVTENIRTGDFNVEIEKVTDTLYHLNLNIENGTIYKTTICISWTKNILLASLPLDKTEVPTELRRKYDVCYQEQENLVENKQYELNVRLFNEIEKDEINILVMDKARFLDDSNNLQENYFYKAQDIGTINKETTIYFEVK